MDDITPAQRAWDEEKAKIDEDRKRLRREFASGRLYIPDARVTRAKLDRRVETLGPRP